MKHCVDCHSFQVDRAVNCHRCSSPQLVERSFPAQQEMAFEKGNISIDAILIREQRYTDCRLIGQGGHGLVLEVIDEMNRSFALKVPFEFNIYFSNGGRGIRKHQMLLSEKYIRHEIKILNRFSKSAEMGIIFAGKIRCVSESGRYEREMEAILMEKASASLKDVMDGCDRGEWQLSLADKMDMIGQISNSADQMHRYGIVHRDISPHNIFIYSSGSRLEYRLGDLGTAKQSDDLGTEHSTTRFAFHNRYFDPALLSHNWLRYDPRVDLFQLGVVFTELLSGCYWRDDEDASDISIQGADFEKEYLRTYCRGIFPTPVWKILRKATSLMVRKRYRSVSSFSSELIKAISRRFEDFRFLDQKVPFRQNIEVQYFMSLTYPFDTKETVADLNNLPIERREFRHSFGRFRLKLSSDSNLELRFSSYRITRFKLGRGTCLAASLKEGSLFIQLNSKDIVSYIQMQSSLKGLKDGDKIELEGECKLWIEGIHWDGK